MLKSLDDCGKTTWATYWTLLFQYGFGFAWLSQEIGDIKLFVSILNKYYTTVSTKICTYPRKLDVNVSTNHNTNTQSMLGDTYHLNSYCIIKE